MPTCPECGKELDHLHAIVEESNKYDIYLEEPPLTGLNWGRPEAQEGTALDIEWNCPYCDHNFFTEKDVNDYSHIELLLKGKYPQVEEKDSSTCPHCGVTMGDNEGSTETFEDGHCEVQCEYCGGRYFYMGRITGLIMKKRGVQ